MKRFAATTLTALALTSGLVWAALGAGTASSGESNQAAADRDLPTAAEARRQAKLLHETMHAALHVVHHHYYREDEGLPIPGVALKDVFRELAQRRNVKLRWLAVSAQAMNVAHNPQDDFETGAAAALASGKEDYELVDGGVYRHVGVITLTSECLKCHLPNRKSTNPRAAGLVITMPIKK